jgi:hypothetical protein
MMVRADYGFIKKPTPIACDCKQKGICLPMEFCRLNERVLVIRLKVALTVCFKHEPENDSAYCLIDLPIYGNLNYEIEHISNLMLQI